MSDDLGKKVQQIAQMLGQENVPDNLKELVTLLATSLGTKDPDAAQSPTSGADIAEKAEGEKTVEAGPAVNPEVLNTARKALDRLNAGSDPRINLLTAIRPFMNSKRQKKIGSCIQLLQVAGLSRLLNEHEK